MDFHAVGEALRAAVVLLVALPSLVHFWITILHLVLDGARETLENPLDLRDNSSVIAGQDWVNGRQAARLR